MNSYRDLRVWQKAMELTLVVYKATREFPKDELYGLTGQIETRSGFDSKQHCGRQRALY